MGKTWECEECQTKVIVDSVEEYDALQDAVYELIQRVRETKTCPGDLTPLMKQLSIAAGLGPLWPETETEKKHGS